MAYQRKTTGIAAHLTMCIAVDPDTGTIKDFSSQAVTDAITVGANVTVASQAWDGVTRSYFKLGAGTTAADFVAFGAAKPRFENNVAGTQRTLVWIGEAAGNTVRCFGDGTAGAYFAGANLGSGGDSFPTILNHGFASAKTGAQPRLAAGTKQIFGCSMIHGTSGIMYWSSDTAAVMSSSNVGAPTSTATSNNYDLDFVGRMDSNTAHQQDKIHAVMIFDTALSESDWDSLRDDWFGTLLEAAGGVTASFAITAEDATFYGNGTVRPTASFAITATDTAFSGGSNSGSSLAFFDLLYDPAIFLGGATGDTTQGTISTPVLKNNTGTILSAETGILAYVYDVSTGVLVVAKTGLVTNSSGVLTFTDAALIVGITYRIVIVLSSGAEGMDKVAAT